MSDARFVQIHFLTSYPASLLNRDDVGFAKRIPFGGVTRTRISSQCLKRHWRTFNGEHALSSLLAADESMSIRSRLTFDRYVITPLIQEHKVDAAVARAVTLAIMAEVLGKSEKAKKEASQEGAEEKKGKKSKEPDSKEQSVETAQVTVLGRPEVDYLLAQARAICAEKPELDDKGKLTKEWQKKLAVSLKQRKENLRVLGKAAGLDAALFGRMVTSDILARGDSAVHVAHPMTVHKEATETDYFSAVDDLLPAGELGAGHINTSELTSGLYYGYVVVDVPLLVSNLEGCEQKDWAKTDRTLAGNIIERLIHLAATVSPGAKLGATAPYAYANLVAVETGKAQPRTLANAFLVPVREQPNLVENAYRAMAEHIRELDAVYGAVDRRFVAIGPTDALQPGLRPENDLENLAALAQWAAVCVKGSNATKAPQ
jgi:CRISPR system Cascade subunit CasC